MMHLTVMTPVETVLDAQAAKILAEAVNGAFCLLPGHVDLVTILTKGIFSYVDASETEHFLAVDAGVLVKQGGRVFVSCRHAVKGAALGELRATVEERFKHLSTQEEKAKRAMNKIEAGVVRRFLDMRDFT